MDDKRTANGIDRKLGERVRERRLEIGLSQEDLASQLSVTFQQVQKYEKGENRIAASRLFAIAHALDMPVSRFFEGLAPRGAGKSTSGGESAIERALASEDGAELMKLFAAIADPRVRKRLVSLAEAVAADET